MAVIFFCSNCAFSQGIETHQMVEKEYRKLDSNLNLTYGQLLKKLTQKKEEGESEKRYVVEEQRLWLRYREAYSKLVAHQNSGSGSGIFEYQAKIELTRKREEELKEALESSN